MPALALKNLKKLEDETRENKITKADIKDATKKIGRYEYKLKKAIDEEIKT